MSRNKNSTIAGVVAIYLLMFVGIAGCKLPEPAKAATPHDRIKLFQDALNSGSTADIQANFSTDVSLYDQTNTPSFWTGSQYDHGTYAPFTITTGTSAASDPKYIGSMKETENFTNNTVSNVPLAFWMINSTGDNWQIRELSYNNSTTKGVDDIY